MTIAKDFASKAAIAFVAFAMIFSMFAPSAKAQSSEDLQAQINTLLAQIAALSETPATSASASAVCPYTWTRDLKTGATGADVKMLQMFLNSNADTRVAATGAGSTGMETETFGPATAAAVSKFQVMHRADTLTPAGLVNPTGYFGPSSRAKANSLCASAPVVTPGEDDEDDEEVAGDLQGEASLNDLTIDSASDDELEEGSEDAEIAEVTVEFEDGDASISRMDVTLTGDADVWDVLDTVTLWVDGDEVASFDASDEDDYLDTDGATGTIRFSGLDIVAMEDEELEIVVAATLQGSIDSDDLGDFTVMVDTLRFFDADGVATTEDAPTFDLGETVAFTITEAGADDELIVKTSSADPSGTTLQVEDDKKSDSYNVFTFDLDSDDSVNDVELTTVVMNVYTTFGTSTYNLLVDDAELVIDGVTIDDVVVTNGGTATATLTFDVDGDVTIEAGERVAAELNLKFKSLRGEFEGATVQAEVTSAQADLVVAEGADDLAAGQLSGAAQGDVHTLRTAGINVAIESVDADVTTGDSATDDYATYVIEVEVTAFEQDVYLSTTPGTSLSYVLENGASVTATTGTRSVTITSTGDEVGSTFEITEGSTETLTFTVTYTPGVAQTAARMQLNSLTFGSSSGTPTGQTWTASPEEDYRTAVVTMVN